MAKLAIKGHPTRGEEVIKLLEMLGGKNVDNFHGEALIDTYYYITDRAVIGIVFSPWLNILTTFSLEEFEAKYPYKVGDEVLVQDYESPVTITSMVWNGEEVVYEIYTGDSEWVTVEDLMPYKEKNMSVPETMKAIADTASRVFLSNDIRSSEQGCISFGNLNMDKVELDLGDDFEIKVEDGKTYAVRKKPKYPKTYGECCEILNTHGTIPNERGYKGELIESFQKLIICRDAYWELAGYWKPDWIDANLIKHIIRVWKGEVGFSIAYCDHNIFSFPTQEMRDAFYENFKDLINECKKLL